MVIGQIAGKFKGIFGGIYMAECGAIEKRLGLKSRPAKSARPYNRK
jgi:hypothetical protein